MSAHNTLDAFKRDISTKNFIRTLRQSGKVPAIVYGHGQDNAPIYLDAKQMKQEYETPGFFGRVYTLTIDGGKPQQVLPKEIQVHPVTDAILHADFQRVSKDAKINVFVSVHFINEDKSPGLKQGCVLNIIHHSLELVCPVNAVPEELVVDLAGATAGQTFHAGVLNLPANAKLAHPERDNTIATIAQPKGAKAEESEQTA